MKYTIEALMGAWQSAAVALWQLNIRDDQGGAAGTRDIIGSIFAGVGWSFWIPDGYKEQNGRNAWCGHTQGYCGLHVGDWLEPGKCVGVTLDVDIAKNVTPSTARLHSANKWRKAGYSKPNTLNGDWLDKMLDNEAAAADIKSSVFNRPQLATIAARDYGDLRNDYGGHVVLIVGVDFEARSFETIEGNAYGELGDGSWGEGVVRRRGDKARKLSELKRVYLLERQHFETIER